MNKESYLRELMDELGGMSPEERREVVADYEEHFRAGVESGKSEEEIARSLGNPQSVGRSYRIDSMLEEGGRPSAAAVLRAVFASLSLGFFNVVVVLGPFIALVAAVAALWVGAASIGLSGVALLVGAFARPLLPASIDLGGFHPAFVAFAGVGFAALGFLALIGMWQLSKWVASVAGKYVQLNVRIISNRR